MTPPSERTIGRTDCSAPSIHSLSGSTSRPTVRQAGQSVFLQCFFDQPHGLRALQPRLRGRRVQDLPKRDLRTLVRQAGRPRSPRTTPTNRGEVLHKRVRPRSSTALVPKTKAPKLGGVSWPRHHRRFATRGDAGLRSPVAFARAQDVTEFGELIDMICGMRGQIVEAAIFLPWDDGGFPVAQFSGTSAKSSTRRGPTNHVGFSAGSRTEKAIRIPGGCDLGAPVSARRALIHGRRPQVVWRLWDPSRHQI